ncbi:MAG: hypothetical protein J0H25_05705, partial [Rhizobiales bacterium]|nr:hypothetical protein [Hyphomicrobiales bacterium]
QAEEVAPVVVAETRRAVPSQVNEGRKLPIPSRDELTLRHALIGAVILVVLVAIVVFVLL